MNPEAHGSGRHESGRLSRILKPAGFVFTVAALAFAAVLVVRHGGELTTRWAELRAAGWDLRPGWLVGALAVGVANLFLLGGAWVDLLRSLGGTIGFLEGMRAWTWTNLGRYLPGRIWQISALTLYLREKRGLGGVGLASSLALQVLLLAVGGAVVFAVLGIPLASGNPLLVGAAVTATVGGLVVALNPSMVARGTGWMSRAMGEPPQDVRPSRRALWRIAALVAVSWVANGVSLWMLWRGAGADAGPGVAFWTGAYAAAYLTGYVALFAPAGLVVREGALAGMLVGLGGVNGAAAAGIAILSRLLAVSSELVATGLAWAWPAGRDEAGMQKPGMQMGPMDEQTEPMDGRGDDS